MAIRCLGKISSIASFLGEEVHDGDVIHICVATPAFVLRSEE
jgi:hypothetical protein